jgi:glutaredoxin
MSVSVTLIGKPGCHLCDNAKAVIDDVLERVADVELEEVSLEDNPLWSELYGDLIPVVLIDGVEYSHWTIEPEAFEHALVEKTSQLA